jgi:cyanophycinase
MVGAVAQNPRIIGIGIDEDTAVIAREGVGFEVIGNGAVYVIDRHAITYTNLSDTKTDDVISVHNVKLDILSRGDAFDTAKRVAIHR